MQNRVLKSPGRNSALAQTMRYTTLLVLLVVGVFNFTDLQAQFNNRPNIVFFLADDMGWGDTRVNNPDSKIPMPNLERLARQGMNFTDAHTSAAKCAPSRYSALSGNYQWRGRLPWGHWLWYGGSQFLPGQQSVADVAKAAGYETAMVGKMHLGGDFYKKNSNEFVNYNSPDSDFDFARGMQNGPKTYGFNYTFTAPRGVQGTPYAYFENDFLVGDVNSLFQWQAGTYGRSIIQKSGIGMPYFDTSETGRVLLRRALGYIDEHHTRNQNNGTNDPFFMFYSAQAAHFPWTPPATLNGKQVDGATGTNAHLDMIYELDVALGALIESLEQRGLADNTLIIFTSDNGGLARADDRALGHNMGAGLRGGKGTIWEGGHRVPFVAKWGDGTQAGSVIRPGSQSRQMIGVHDLMATVAAIVDKPLEIDQARDSFNILPVLLGSRSENEPIRDHIIMEADVIDGVQGPRQFAYREGRWKLIFSENGEPSRLHNMNADIGEIQNQINEPSNAALVQGMTNRFRALYAAERTAPNGSPGGPNCGGPPIDRARDRGLFVWRDCVTREWRVAATGGANLGNGQRVFPTFGGTIRSTNPVSNARVNFDSLESSDSFRVSEQGRKLDFDLKLASGYQGIDQFSFTMNGDSSLCLDVGFENTPQQIFLGPDRRLISQFPVDIKTGRPCNTSPTVQCGNPGINQRSDRGLFLWLDCASSRWHLSAVGGENDFGGNPIHSRFYGSLEASENLSAVSSSTIERPADGFTHNGRRLDFTLTSTSGYGGIDDIGFNVGSDVNLCIRMLAGTDPREIFVGANRQRKVAFPLALGATNICR